MSYRYCKLHMRDFFHKTYFTRIQNLEELNAFDATNNLLHDIIRNESLEKDFIRVVQEAGHQLDQTTIQAIFQKAKKKTNISEHRDSAFYYDNATIELVAQKEAFLKELPKELQKRLKRICNKYLEGCPKHTRHTKMGDPAQEILKFIDSEKVDMVVMPTHGERGIFPFGSVTEKVVKNSTVPVLTIPIQIENDDALRVLVITGAGDKAFVAGADIKELVDRDARLGRRVSRERQEIFSRIENLHVPVIAAVNGYALGGGLELALACSIRICSEKAQFGAPEVKLGIIPGDGGTQRLPRLIGLGRAMEMIITGDFIGAQEAYRIGLVNKVFPPDKLNEEATGLARKIASRPPLAVRYAKEAVNRSQEGDSASGFALESYLHALSCTTEDKKEGVSAFLEKRKGKFKGK